MTKSRDIANSTSTLDVDGGTIKLDGNYPVGTGNVALGDTALDSISSGSNNTAIGSSALTANTSGDNMTAVGQNAGLSHTTGNSSTFIGTDSGKLTTTGIGNTFVGDGSGRQNTTGASNVAMGQSALLSNTTASDNTAVGFSALTANTTGRINTAVGKTSMLANTTGGDNSAFGGLTLDANTTGNNNTAMGYAALSSSTTASNNTAVGFLAGYSNTTGNDSVYVGRQAGLAVTTGVKNTYVGPGTMGTATTGNYNTVIGGFNGNQESLDLRTSSNNIVLSDGAGNPKLHIDSANTTRINHTGNIVIALNPSTLQVKSSSGQNAIKAEVMNEDYVCYGSKSTYAGNYYFAYMTNSSNGLVGSIRCTTSSTSYNTSSDHRLKENVDYTWDATTRLKQLKPARFNFISDTDTTVDGFLAHEAQAVVPEAVHGTHNEVDADGNAVMQGIDQSKLVPLLVKTIQELEARITALEGA